MICFLIVVSIANTFTVEYFRGEVAERLKAAVSKIVMGATPSGVRIPPSPPVIFSDMSGLTF